MKRLLYLAACLMPSLAMAQGQAILQSGPATPGHLYMITANGVAMDAGPALGGPAGANPTELGITATGTPLCINSGPVTAPYYQLCLGANSLGSGLLTFANKGGAPPIPFNCVINGTTIPNCLTPTSGGGGNSPFVTPEQCGATGNGIADDSSALQACDIRAVAAQTSLLLTKTYLVAVPITLNAPELYVANASIRPNTSITVTINGAVSAPDTAVIFGGLGTVSIPNTPRISVSWWGATPSAADAGPGFRAASAIAGNRYVVIPPGSYLCASTVPSGYPTLITPPCAIFASQTDFTLDARGATINVSNATAYSTIFFFHDDQRFNVIGGTFVGNHTGVDDVHISNALCAFNIVDFTFQGQSFTGNWGGISSPYCGDWQVNGAYRDQQIHTAGQCFDMGFLQNVTFDNIHGYGADSNGASGLNQIGQKCVSIIYNSLTAGLNNTGYTFTEANNVTVTNSSATNFLEGFLLNGGHDYSFIGNHWEGNPGCTAASPGGNCPGAAGGFGGLILYDPAFSVGHPVHGFTSSGEVYTNNGNGTAGGEGLLISVGAISNSDQITTIAVNGSIFDNNNNIGIETSNSPGTKLQNVVLNPICMGSVQGSCIGPNMVSVSPLAWNNTVNSFSSVTGSELHETSLILGTGASFDSAVLPSSSGVTPPTLGSGSGDCGTSPVLAGSAINGHITVGSGANGSQCTLTFAVAWPQRPTCIVWSESVRGVFPLPTPSALIIHANSTLNAGDVLGYICKGVE